MKLFKISTSVILTMFIAYTVISCKNNKKKNNNQKALVSTKIVDNYLQLKNALFDDNKQKAAEAGKMMLESFSNFDLNKLPENEHQKYTEIAKNAEEHIKHIIAGPIEHQRKHFKALSSNIKSLIILDGSEKTIYQDFCPMYNDGNGKGAIWLSEFKEIKNPYYGKNSKYISCGSKQKKM